MRALVVLGVVWIAISAVAALIVVLAPFLPSVPGDDE